LIEKTKERETAELSTIYGMGAQHKEKILEGIRELEQEHDREARN
jgi:DNA polymerase/3'-5' exonuclease PolX